MLTKNSFSFLLGVALIGKPVIAGWDLEGNCFKGLTLLEGVPYSFILLGMWMCGRCFSSCDLGGL